MLHLFLEHAHGLKLGKGAFVGMRFGGVKMSHVLLLCRHISGRSRQAFS